MMFLFARHSARTTPSVTTASPRDARHRAAGPALIALLLLAGPVAAQQVAQSHLTMPRYGSNGLTEEYFTVDLGSGRVSLADQLRREPERVRLSRTEMNLFAEIGRPGDQPAQPGEILLMPIRESDGSVRTALFVETSTGYTVFFDEVGRNDELGKITTTIGRPFGPLAAEDLNFVLLPRRDGSGKTVGAYLYHGTTGKGLYVSGLDEIVPDPPVSATVALPQSTGYITAAPITSEEQTQAYVVIDSGTGEVYFLDVRGQPEQLLERRSALRLFDEFAAEKLNVAPRRFYPMPLQDGEETTQRVLLIDAGSGKLGLLDGIRTQAPRVAMLPQNLYDAITGGIQTEPRHFELIANRDSGGTRGLWLVDSMTNSLLFIERPDSPSDLRIRRAAVGR